MNDRGLLEQALDVMESAIGAGDWKVDGACDPDWVLNAIRARLAQCDAGEICLGCRVCPDARLEQEPVAWYDKHEMITHDPFEGVTPLYTAPPQREWQGLTTGERIDIVNNAIGLMDGICDAEAKLKEKNCSCPQPQREWRGLTSAERKTLWNLSTKPMHFAEMIEAKLKEKNS